MIPNTSKRRQICLAAASAGAALALTACGGEADSPVAADSPDYSAAVEAAPPPLSALYADGPAIVEGELAAYEDQIAALHGYPIVVNKWASWCGPCRAEFPHLQEQAAAHADEVAFLGVNSDDSTAAAETFLRENPVPYPSISDPDKVIASALASVEFPTTVFYDKTGGIVHTQPGPYSSEEELAADIERYALGS